MRKLAIEERRGAYTGEHIPQTGDGNFGNSFQMKVPTRGRPLLSVSLEALLYFVWKSSGVLAAAAFPVTT